MDLLPVKAPTPGGGWDIEYFKEAGVIATGTGSGTSDPATSKGIDLDYLKQANVVTGPSGLNTFQDAPGTQA